MDIDELKITLTMLDIDWQQYWRLNHNNGDIMLNINIFKAKPEIESFIFDLLKNNKFKYEIKSYLIDDTKVIIYNKR